MTQNKKITSRVLVLVLLLAIVGAPEFPLLHQANAQDISVNGNTSLAIRALGINNEVQQINSLLGVQAKFFKKAFELQAKTTLSLDEKTQLSAEAVQRKADVTTLKNQFESLISKLKQKNNWNEAFDAQFLASLKNASDRSLLTQAGGARKLLEAGAADFDGLRDFIDQEVRQVSNRQARHLRSKSNQVNAAHASAPLGNFGCAALQAAYILATASGSENSISCAAAMLYNRRNCKPGIVSGAACH